MFYIIMYLILGTSSQGGLKVAETVKERLMKRYKGEMLQATDEQRERNQRRAARPIIIFMAVIFLLGAMPLVFKLC